MGIGDLAAIAAATAASALAEEVTLRWRKDGFWEGRAVVSPDAAVDSATGTPVIANTAFALITHEDWEAGGGEATGPVSSSKLQQGSKKWSVRAVLADGGWWRLEMVKVLN